MAGWTPTDETDWYDIYGTSIQEFIHGVRLRSDGLKGFSVAVACFQCPLETPADLPICGQPPCRFETTNGGIDFYFDAPVPNASRVRVWNIVLDETRRRLNQRAQIVYWTTIGGTQLASGVSGEVVASATSRDGNTMATTILTSHPVPEYYIPKTVTPDWNNLNNWNGGDLTRSWSFRTGSMDMWKNGHNTQYISSRTYFEVTNSHSLVAGSASNGPVRYRAGTCISTGTHLPES